MRILSFDIGIKHTAWSIVSYDDTHQIDPTVSWTTDQPLPSSIQIQSFDLINVFDTQMHQIYCNIHQYLRSMTSLWDTVDVILIEQQMSTKSMYNIKAVKLSQHIYAFFLLYYPMKQVQEFQPNLKTSMFHVQFPRTRERKQWSVQQVTHFLQTSDDPVAYDLFQCYSKKDDISDSILMGIVFGFVMINHNHKKKTLSIHK